VINAIGIRYYTSTMAERVHSPYHVWLRPSGIIGQSAGILAFALFLFLWLYPLRKRMRVLSFLGSVPRILDLHIAAGLLIPLLAATHAGWRFTGLIGLGYDAMFVVCLSGIAGRFLYVRIPRTRAGLEMGLAEVEAERIRLLGELSEMTGMAVPVLERALRVEAPPTVPLGIRSTLKRLVADDLARRRSVASLRREIERTQKGSLQLDRGTLHRFVVIANRQVALVQRSRLVDSTQRVFRYWHVAHVPIAITALFAVIAHVTVAIVLGATWFR
jgi:hypothetical protein